MQRLLFGFGGRLHNKFLDKSPRISLFHCFINAKSTWTIQHAHRTHSHSGSSWTECVYVYVCVAYPMSPLSLNYVVVRCKSKISTQLNHATPKVKNKNKFEEELKTFDQKFRCELHSKMATTTSTLRELRKLFRLQNIQMKKKKWNWNKMTQKYERDLVAAGKMMLLKLHGILFLFTIYFARNVGLRWTFLFTE